ncbi:hypothetical protein Nepgr_024832 [Nepenthes gracilis]|uniref:PTBP1-like RNA recognition motif 2 domain-containing protein n=1 Tax=Nepenthes gracilis TaxID=150966 RepID=A0AAD3T555_NEPGR|nr:hypothetical protein Nepgr_024832 [Nepenthes gracilis]
MGNLLYPVTHDILHQVFSPNGTIGRIMLIPCSNKKIAIIHQSSHKAISARSSLNGRNIYDYCCHLEILFSGEFWIGMYEKFIYNIVFNGTSAKTYLNEDLYEVDQQQYNVSQSNSEISMEHDDHDVLFTVPGAKPLELDLDDESESEEQWVFSDKEHDEVQCNVAVPGKVFTISIQIVSRLTFPKGNFTNLIQLIEKKLMNLVVNQILMLIQK